ncbi:hypothetical protein [Synechococcus phage BUCT-ZZ01]|nr:hypothetical protein [Synechococcus phage BUCT-ZZ01]
MFSFIGKVAKYAYFEAMGVKEDTKPQVIFKTVTEKAVIKEIFDPYFIADGDQGFPQVQALRRKYDDSIEIHFCAAMSKASVPNKIKNDNRVIKHRLAGFSRKGKETTDKYIGMLIQRQIDKGHRSFVVASSDYDFVCMFKMLYELNKHIKNQLNFTLVVTDPHRLLTNMIDKNIIKVLIDTPAEKGTNQNGCQQKLTEQSKDAACVPNQHDCGMVQV